MQLFMLLSTAKKPIIYRFFGCALKLPYFFGAIICFSLSAPVFSTEVSRGEFTLYQAIQLSLQSHPSLKAYKHRFASVNAQAKHAAIGEKPEINLMIEDTLGTGELTGLDNSQTTLSISWILQSDLLNKRVKYAQTKKSVLEIEHDIQRFDVAAQAAHAFLAVLANQERLVVAKNAQNHALQILKEIQKRVDAGRSPYADILQAEVNLERRKLDAANIQQELKSAKKVLASQWGSNSVDFECVNGMLTLNKQIVSYNSLENAIKNNPQVRYFLTQQRVIDSEITLAREEVKNRLRLITGVRRYESTEDYGLSFGVPLPLGKSTRNQHKVSALHADRAAYASDAWATQIQLSTQLYVLYQELQHSHHLNNAITYKILPRLEKALTETQKAFSLGKYSYREWYALQNEVLDTRMELIDVRLKALNNMTEIERLTGLNLRETLTVKESENSGDIQ